MYLSYGIAFLALSRRSWRTGNHYTGLIHSLLFRERITHYGTRFTTLLLPSTWLPQEKFHL
ncbi:hypothetical protein C2E21_8802 [Chlorella sorokiniana]|uniref:Uncharacterized protein n=1 Tax=Chlorella sorokiniana TaxID=3076 RepID=A0A2P6TDQ9_CHLSO|nr:hypothetical protein C2E21_8802 [Chlorella sorokiniana]|eukprot:PRW20762.1 hypothetical protein C2E21_8802 [Chlorella sorokiniana]